MWNKKPSLTQLKNVTKKEFKLNLSNYYLKDLQKAVEQFFKKGKDMVKSDLQHIIEDILINIYIIALLFYIIIDGCQD